MEFLCFLPSAIQHFSSKFSFNSFFYLLFLVGLLRIYLISSASGSLTLIFSFTIRIAWSFTGVLFLLLVLSAFDNYVLFTWSLILFFRSRWSLVDEIIHIFCLFLRLRLSHLSLPVFLCSGKTRVCTDFLSLFFLSFFQNRPFYKIPIYVVAKGKAGKGTENKSS